MSKSIMRFLAHLQHKEAKFRCGPAGGRKAKAIEIPIRQDLNKPATAKHLATLRRLLNSHAAKFEPLYAKHNGGALYVQPPDNAGLLLYPINEWESATRRFKKELDEWGRDSDELYDFEREGVIFGEPPASGNHLFLFEGAVYYSNHDGGDDEPLAPSFDAFLDRVVDDPAKFLYDLGCYARYSDGRTKEQWIPEKYVP